MEMEAENCYPVGSEDVDVFGLCKGLGGGRDVIDVLIFVCFLFLSFVFVLFCFSPFPVA